MNISYFVIGYLNREIEVVKNGKMQILVRGCKCILKLEENIKERHHAAFYMKDGSFVNTYVDRNEILISGIPDNKEEIKMNFGKDIFLDEFVYGENVA